MKTKKKKLACEECHEKKKKCSGKTPCSRCTQLGLREECVPLLQKRRGPRRRILDEEVRVEVRGEIVEVVLPAKQQTILTLLLLYGEEALKKRPHETAEAFRVGLLSQGFVTYAMRNDGEMVKLVEEGEGWNIGEAELRHEVARAAEGVERVGICRSSVEWGELNVFIDGAGRARWIVVRRYEYDEFLQRKKSSLTTDSESDDELFDMPIKLDISMGAASLGDKIL